MGGEVQHAGQACTDMSHVQRAIAQLALESPENSGARFADHAGGPLEDRRRHYGELQGRLLVGIVCV